MTFTPTTGLALDAASGVFLLLLAALVARVRPHRRVQRAFAVFAGAWGLSIAVGNVGTMFSATDIARLALFAAAAFAMLPAIGGLLFLAMEFPRPLEARLRRGAAVAASVSVAYALVFGFAYATTNVAPNAWGFLFFIFSALFWFPLLLLPLRFGDAEGASSARERQLCALMAVALSFWPASFVPIVALPVPAWNSVLAWGAVALLGSTAVWWLSHTRVPDPASRRIARTVALASLAAPIVAALLFQLQGVTGLQGGSAGLMRTGAVLVLAYAILKHELLGIDVKLKWTIKQSTLAGAFIGVFFIVSEIAQQVFSQSVGPYMGIVAAGGLLFALAPLQRAAERVASAAMPGARPVAELTSDDRARLYREQVRFMWSDGSLSEDERRALVHLRDQLGLSRDEAARLEEEALSERARPSGPAP